MTQAHAQPHAHPPHVAHHFDSAQQQFESSKLGMWVFLITEILMFSGLFCAYAVYRANHPAVFLYGSQYMDKTMGAINTAVLLATSFTMSWAVRAAQLGQRKILLTMLSLTLFGGVVFLGIKGDSYAQHINEDLGPGWANLFALNSASQKRALSHDLPRLEQENDLNAYSEQPSPPDTADTPSVSEGQSAAQATMQTGHRSGTRASGSVTPPPMPEIQAAHSSIAPAGDPPGGMNPAFVNSPGRFSPTRPKDYTYETLAPPAQSRVQIFFACYFLMTGLHAVHMLVALGLVGYLLVRAYKDHFGPAYFTPVDAISLYWHLVDCVWIFLFPLLYLIH